MMTRNLDRRLERLETGASGGEHVSLLDLLLAVERAVAAGEQPSEPREYSEEEIALAEQQCGGVVAAILRAGSRGAGRHSA